MSTDTLDMFAIETKSSAIISECGAYRYRLERQWDGEKPNVAFLMLNPCHARILRSSRGDPHGSKGYSRSASADDPYRSPVGDRDGDRK